MARWSIPIERLAARAGLRLEDVARKVAFDVFSQVVRKSPVDTGRFRANWNFSVGAPDFSTTAATSAARGEIEARQALTAPVGGVLYISNGLPYARRLEYGWSKQAPYGMVRTTVFSYAAAVRRALQ